MRKSSWLALPFLLAIGCGPDADLVASGEAHACAAADLREQIASNPDDPALQTQLEEREELLEAVVETAEEGDRAALRTAIDEAVADGCD